LKLFLLWGVGNKENDGRGESNYDTMIHCKNFCKCRNVPQYNNNKEANSTAQEGEYENK
jgi:hypothetical protein